MRVWALTRRFIFALMIVAGFLCAGAWSYTVYQARRAESLMGEASRVRIGDSAASVSPLIGRYRGRKWEPPGTTRGTLGPRENWVNSEAYERALKTYPDYVYSMEVNPWGFPTFGPSSRFAKAARRVINAIPNEVRSPLGLRDWVSSLDIRIRNGRVSEVEGLVMIEGRTRWLNQSWFLADNPSAAGSYFIQPENVLMREGRSSGIRNFITPQAPEKQAEAAHNWNMGCITSLRACRTRCQLSPRAFQYWKAHPDIAGGTWEPTCE